MSDVERYIVRGAAPRKSEWAFIYVDEETGVFSAYSSFGTYAYCWTHIGTRTLKEFLRGLDFDYFMGKTRRDYRRFDADATIDGIKEHILEGRRYGSLTKEEARAAWSDLDGLHGNQHGFFDAFCWSKPLMEVYGGDYCDIARECPDGNSRGFWEVIWPEFLKRITPAVEAA